MVSVFKWFFGRRCKLKKELEKRGITGNMKDAVLNAMKCALDCDPILILFWNQQRLAQLNAKAGQTKQAIVAGFLSLPGVSAASPAPEEVFNLADTEDINKVLNMVNLQFAWAKGGMGVAQPVARAVLVLELKKKVPTFMDYPLFGTE